MKLKVLLFLCVLSLLFSVSSAYCDVVGDLPKLVFPVEGSQKCQHLEGSSAHVFGLPWREGPRVSELFALDLSGGDVIKGAAVRPIAPGVVEYIAKGDSNYGDGDYGWVLVRHDQRPITTQSNFVNRYVEGRRWYSGYMHMQNISVSVGETVDTNTKIGEVSNHYPKTRGSVPVHLHFAVYDEDMYSFSPYLLSEIFRSGKIDYKHDGGVATHYKSNNDILEKYRSTSTIAWYGSTEYPNYRNSTLKEIMPDGTYTAVRGVFSSKKRQQSSPLTSGYINIQGVTEGVNTDWMILDGEAEFTDGSWFSIHGKRVFAFNKKYSGENSECIFREWDVNSPEHIHYGDSFYGDPPVYRARETIYRIRQQDNSDTFVFTIEHNYSSIEGSVK